MSQQQFRAIMSNDLPLVKRLLSKETINKTSQRNHETPLIIASTHGHLPIVKYLVNIPGSKGSRPTWSVRSLQGTYSETIRCADIGKNMQIATRNTETGSSAPVS